jgi:hypothetical protein
VYDLHTVRLADQTNEENLSAPITQILAISPTRAGCLEMIRHRLMINPSVECVGLEYDYHSGE